MGNDVDLAVLDQAPVVEIPLDMIERNPLNPRQEFGEEGLDELAESIRRVGVLQPVLICRNDAGGFLLVAGERRWRAARKAGLRTVPAIVRELSRREQLEVMLMENLQREDLTPMEEARAFRIFIDECGLTQVQVGERIGKSQEYVANRLRLLRLPEDVQDAISREIISPGVGMQLLRLEKGPKLLRQAAERAIQDRASVAEVQYRVDQILSYDAKALGVEEELGRRPWGAPEFPVERCESCDHRAIVGDKPRCLDPECWTKRQAKAQEERIEAVRKEVLKKLRAAGKDVKNLPTTTELGYRNYERFRKEDLLPKDYEACLKCESLSMAIDYDKKPVEVCLKPRCYARKKGALTRDRSAKERDVRLGRALKIRENLQDIIGAGVNRRVLQFVAGLLLACIENHWQCITRPQYLAKLWQMKAGDFTSSYEILAGQWRRLMAILDKLSDEEILRIIVEWPAVALGSRSQPLRWLRGEGEKEEVMDDLDEVLDELAEDSEDPGQAAS